MTTHTQDQHSAVLQLGTAAQHIEAAHDLIATLREAQQDPEAHRSMELLMRTCTDAAALARRAAQGLRKL